jgi:hypothetical protein
MCMSMVERETARFQVTNKKSTNGQIPKEDNPRTACFLVLENEGIFAFFYFLKEKQHPSYIIC